MPRAEIPLPLDATSSTSSSGPDPNLTFVQLKGPEKAFPRQKVSLPLKPLLPRVWCQPGTQLALMSRTLASYPWHRSRAVTGIGCIEMHFSPASRLLTPGSRRRLATCVYPPPTQRPRAGQVGDGGSHELLAGRHLGQVTRLRGEYIMALIGPLV